MSLVKDKMRRDESPCILAGLERLEGLGVDGFIS